MSDIVTYFNPLTAIPTLKNNFLVMRYAFHGRKKKFFWAAITGYAFSLYTFQAYIDEYRNFVSDHDNRR